MANNNLYKSYAWAFFDCSHRFPDIHISNLPTLKMQVKVMMYNIRSGAIRWKIHDFLSDDNGDVWIFPTDTCQNGQLKSLTLKM